VASHAHKTIAIGHNGNLTNAIRLKNQLEGNGSIFQTTMDSEIIVHLLARNLRRGVEEALAKAMSQIEGAYSCVLMTEKKLVAFRDPNGFRPLCLGKLDGGYVVASETCALDLIDAQYVRDIEPGEILIISEEGLQSLKPLDKRRTSFCIFEFIYFARPDSNIFGQNVYAIRKRLGEKLAQEYPLEADFAMPFPDSGNYASIGFCHGSGIPLEMGVIRNHYVGRTFIEPAQSMRDFGVKVKLNPVREILDQKRVVIIEDSIIRGTTSKMRIKTLRKAGAREIHMMVSCPPHRYPCYYGIDFSTRGELIASQNTVEEVRDFIGLDSLCYLSLPGMVEATGLEENGFCLACFDGKYPVQPDEDFSKLCLE
jgi:amidophosphoribosyltransferase